MKAYTDILGLSSLESGYDSIQLRIWFEYGLLKKGHLVIISNKNQKWSGKLYEFSIDRKSDTLYYLESKTEKIVKMNDSKWEQLIGQMNSLNISSLPSCEYLPNYGYGVDGDYYMIEVATEDKYRFYNYFSPKSMSEEFKEAGALDTFLTILEKEFGFERAVEM